MRRPRAPNRSRRVRKTRRPPESARAERHDRAPAGEGPLRAGPWSAALQGASRSAADGAAPSDCRSPGEFERSRAARGIPARAPRCGHRTSPGVPGKRGQLRARFEIRQVVGQMCASSTVSSRWSSSRERSDQVVASWFAPSTRSIAMSAARAARRLDRPILKQALSRKEVENKAGAQFEVGAGLDVGLQPDTLHAEDRDDKADPDWALRRAQPGDDPAQPRGFAYPVRASGGESAVHERGGTAPTRRDRTARRADGRRRRARIIRAHVRDAGGSQDAAAQDPLAGATFAVEWGA